MHFGSALRLLRLDAGLSLGELARRIGVSTAYLSRVEHGHDSAPTPDRLAAIARELDMPPAVLLELSANTGPALAGYLQRVPAAGALFLDIARRNLGAAELARVQEFIDATFADERRAAPRPVRISALLEPAHVIVGVRGSDLEDVAELAAMRWEPDDAASARAVVERILAREDQAPSAIGSGVAVPHAIVRGAPTRAAAITLARPLSMPTPDGKPVRLAFVILSPSAGRRHLETLAQAARLASRGVADATAGLSDPAAILRRIEALELV